MQDREWDIFGRKHIPASPHFDGLSIEYSGYNAVLSVNGVDLWGELDHEKEEVENPDYIDDYIHSILKTFSLPQQASDICHSCRGTALTKINYGINRSSEEDGENFSEDGPLVDAELGVCNSCLSWQWSMTQHECHYGDFNYYHMAYSKLRTFEESLPPGFESELSQHVYRDPDLWNKLPPKRLEVLVAEMLRANFRHTEVLHVGRPDDGGVDVLFIDDGGMQWLVQVKRREDPSKAERVETLRNLLGAMLVQDVHQSILVSTATRFSPATLRDKRKAKAAAGYHVGLVDRGHLARLLGKVPLLPWMRLMEEVYPDAREKILAGTKHLTQPPWLKLDDI